MDPKRFDRLARTLGKAKLDRRGVAGAVLAVGGLAGAYRLIFAQPACAGDGQSCTIMGGCCDGFVCHVSMVNPNFGACRAGEDILGTGWTFAGMTTLPAVATEIARERRRKKGRNKNRNSNKRARATATPTPVPTATATPIAQPDQTPTPDPGDGPTPVPTAGPDVTPPPNDQSVDLAIDIDWEFDPEVTKFRNKGVTNLKVVVVKTGMECCKPNLDVPVGETRELLSGDGRSCARLYYDGRDKVEVLLSYQSAPGVVGYVAYRGYCNGDPAARLTEPVVSCTAS